MVNSTHGQFKCCYLNWIAQQHQDLDELLQTLSSFPEDNEKLNCLIEKSTKHFEDYAENRAILSQQDGPLIFSASWCSTFENSFHWIGGCRPTLFIRLVYSLCGSGIEARIGEYLNGERNGDLGEISADQLNLISNLQMKTVKEEDKLSTQMASLQEDIADDPLVKIANSTRVGEMNDAVEKAMDALALTPSNMLIAADKLKVSTYKALMHILTPLQAVHLLVAAKKLHLSVHEWGMKRYQVHGMC